MLLSTSTAVVIRDGFPVTEGHSLVIPRRHIESVFNLTEEEFQDLGELSSDVRRRLLDSDDTIEGFNIGVNDGTVQGRQCRTAMSTLSLAGRVTLQTHVGV